VFRTADNQTTGFSKIGFVNALTYLDVHPSTTEPTTTWKYFVTAEFQDSLNPAPPMLTVRISVPTSSILHGFC
jgi:hypothetical protein